MELRYYQTQAIDQLRTALKEGHKKIIMVLPTGGGKSHIFGQVIANMSEKGKKVLWIVHRRNLVHQMKDVLKEHFGIEAGIIMSGVEHDEEKPIQLGTIQTYARRIKLDVFSNTHFFHDAQVILCDEAHHIVSPQYKNLLESYYDDKIIIGCTATPCRADGRGLGEIFTKLVEVAKVKDLTDQGYLAPARYFAPVHIELDGVKVAMGDYVVKELEGKVNKAKIIGDVIENWLKLAEGRKTLVYAVNVAHSKNLCEAFNRAGIPAENLDARSSDNEREKVFNDMEKGKIQVVTNVALYQEGMDVPGISCVVIARPTKSMGLYRQMVGRGLRPLPGKLDTMILDHGNVIEEHGLVDWDIEWTLNGKERAWRRPRKEVVEKMVTCRVCHEVFHGAKVCPTCGTGIKSFGKAIKTMEAELEEIDSKRPKASMVDKRIFYGMLKYHARLKGYAEGWCSHKFREKFKVWPNAVKDVSPIEPDDAFKSYLKYLNIKWAKSKNNQKTQDNLIHGGELVEQYQLTNKLNSDTLNVP